MTTRIWSGVHRSPVSMQWRGSLMLTIRQRWHACVATPSASSAPRSNTNRLTARCWRTGTSVKMISMTRICNGFWPTPRTAHSASGRSRRTRVVTASYVWSASTSSVGCACEIGASMGITTVTSWNSTTRNMNRCRKWNGTFTSLSDITTT